MPDSTSYLKLDTDHSVRRRRRRCVRGVEAVRAVLEARAATASAGQE